MQSTFNRLYSSIRPPLSSPLFLPPIAFDRGDIQPSSVDGCALSTTTKGGNLFWYSMVPLVLVYCTVLRTLKPCDWPLPSIPFHFFCACVCVHSSDSEPRTLAPCLNLDATPRISMTSTLTFLPPKAASKRALFMTSPHHSPVRWKCDLLFYSSYPVPLNCLFLFLYIVFSFDVVTQEVARSNPPRFQNSLSV